MMVARDGVEPPTPAFSDNLSDFRWPPKYLRSRERHANRGLKSWVQNRRRKLISRGTRAPATPNAVATPAPMPLDAPVTIATFSDSLLTTYHRSSSDSPYTRTPIVGNRASTYAVPFQSV